MGCCVSSPHTKRRYRDPADFDEEFVPEDQLRTFGIYRNSQVVVPDDIDGLPSTHINNKDTLLYQAEIDNGRSWRCLRGYCCLVPLWPVIAVQAVAMKLCSCDEMCCWLRKEYSTRTFYRVYPNRIEINTPFFRIPFGMFGCGSWNGDLIVTHPFDRGAFGFRRVKFGTIRLGFCCWPLYGDVVARQRCQCNGPVWHGGWWCEEWPCDMFFCTYKYSGLADGDETAFASNLALQAYFEGRTISEEDMKECVTYWREKVSDINSPRSVCCEPFSVPCCSGARVYKRFCQCKRTIPKSYKKTEELEKVFDNYERLRQRQVKKYETHKGPRLNSCCKAFGCLRCCGRKGCCFCTEGCCDNDAAGCCYTKLKRRHGDPFPPHPYPDIDDENDAARILQTVLGNPPANVEYKRWELVKSTGQYTAVVHPKEQANSIESAGEPAPEETQAGAAQTDEKPQPQLAG